MNLLRVLSLSTFLGFVAGHAPAEQIASLEALKAAGVQMHVTRLPQTADTPYMHARTAIADGWLAYMGSISLSPDAATYNRNVGLILDEQGFVATIRDQFEIDFAMKSAPY